MNNLAFLFQKTQKLFRPKQIGVSKPGPPLEHPETPPEHPGTPRNIPEHPWNTSEHPETPPKQPGKDRNNPGTPQEILIISRNTLETARITPRTPKIVVSCQTALKLTKPKTSEDSQFFIRL